MSEAETQYSINNTAHRYWSGSSHSTETEAEVEQANLIKELKSVPDPSNHVRENSPAYNQFFMWFLITGAFTSGYNLGSGTLVTWKMLKFSFGFPEHEIPYYIGWINSTFMIGAFTGSFIASQFSMKLGRVKTLIIGEAFSVLAHTLLFLFDGLWVVFVMRFCSGVAAGMAMCLIILTIVEMLPKKYTVMAGGYMSYCTTGGLLLLSAISFKYSSSDPNESDATGTHWKCILGSQFFLHIGRLFFHIVFFNFDTPKFYLEQMLNSKDEESIEKYRNLSLDTLKKLYNEEDVPQIQDFMIAQQRLKNFEVKLTFGALFKKPYLRPLLTNLSIGAGLDISGTNFFAFMAVKVFQDIGGNGSMALLIGTLMRLVGAKFAMNTIGSYGIKCSLVLGTAIQAIGFQGLYIAAEYRLVFMSYIVLMISRTGFTCSTCSFHVFQARSLPPNGVALIWMSTFMFGTIVSGFAPVALAKFGIPSCLLFFGTICTLVAVVLDIFVGDDQGKTPTEMIEEYASFRYYKPFVSIKRVYASQSVSETFLYKQRLVKSLFLYGIIPVGWVVYNLQNNESIYQVMVDFLGSSLGAQFPDERKVLDLQCRKNEWVRLL